MPGFVRRMLSNVRVRVTAAALLAVGCALVFSAGFIEGSLQHDRQHILMMTAQEAASEVADFNPSHASTLTFPPNQTLQSGLVQVIRNGKVVGASRQLAKVPPLWQPGEPVVQQNTYVFAGQATDAHVVAVPLKVAGSSSVVVVVTSLDQYDHLLRYVRQLLGVGTPILLAVVGLICWVIVGRALRPIEAMRREVTEIATIPGTHRVAEPATDDEVGRLARTLNSMLDRIEASAARERRFVSDASHELRSPIANIRTEIEVALHHPQRADWRSVATDVLAENDRMARLVEELLFLARSDEGSLQRPVGSSDLAEVAVEVVSAASASQPPVLLRAEPTPVAMPEIYVERIVVNLVENARRFANSRVEVFVGHRSGFGVLEVRDDGPGVPVAERGRIFERFVRLDEARDREFGGFGLGLAIVADLCRAYGGTAEVGDASPGAVFTLRLPLATASQRRALRHAGAV
jgi:signal transduction histidine kinase